MYYCGLYHVMLCNTVLTVSLHRLSCVVLLVGPRLPTQRNNSQSVTQSLGASRLKPSTPTPPSSLSAPDKLPRSVSNNSLGGSGPGSRALPPPPSRGNNSPTTRSALPPSSRHPNAPTPPLGRASSSTSLSSSHQTPQARTISPNPAPSSRPNPPSHPGRNSTSAPTIPRGVPPPPPGRKNPAPATSSSTSQSSRLEVPRI